jgi:TrmH family RNA methyltransferase
VQRLRRLLGRRSARQEEGAFVIEGDKLLAEAVAAGVPVQEVFVAAGYVAPTSIDGAAVVHYLAPGVLERIADTVAPQPVLAVVPTLDVPLDRLAHATFLVVCVDVRDPGNAGTVLRSAEAAGADGVVCCDGSVDIYNPKTVRASAGSLFHVPVVVGGGAVEVLEQISAWGITCVGTQVHAGTPYTALDLTRPVAIVLGNEANGLDPAAAARVDETATIPMAGRSESLNVGMAAAVLCFETARQRREGDA